MKVVFRTDASLDIGTGHVMRCLTLAEALKAKGAECQFISRKHEGNLIDFISGKGFIVHTLPTDNHAIADSADQVTGLPTCVAVHHHWLGTTQARDSEACAAIIESQLPDWLVVDHYAIDAHWESALAPYYRNLMIIDDLADRLHTCDLLLDQTYGRDVKDYDHLVTPNCQLLCGSQFALLRPEFAALRPYSLQRRARPVLRELLINMGGVDKDNATGKVLGALRYCLLPTDCRITVVMGAMAPWLNEVLTQAQVMPYATRVLVGVSHMAQLMADSDLAIGAAGTTSWERCCLGLPTIMLELAENQRKVAHGLERSGGVRLIQLDQITTAKLSELLLSVLNDPAQLLHMSECAASVVDGSGVGAVMRLMEG